MRQGLCLGHGHRPQRVQRLQRVRGLLHLREQHPRGRQARRCCAAARCSGSASIAITKAIRTRRPSTTSRSPACSAKTRRAGGLPGGRDDPQHGRPERHGLQPLRGHALLLEQLSLQGAAVQLPALSGLDDADAEDGAESGRHGPQPRRDGEVHLLRAAHQSRAHPGQARKIARSRTARCRRRVETACPSQAITFGNINDPEAAVTKLKKEPREYGLLEDLNTRPRTTYLAVVRNPNPEITPAAVRAAHGSSHETSPAAAPAGH